MAEREGKIENPKSRVALVARWVSIFFGSFCIEIPSVEDFVST